MPPFSERLVAPDGSFGHEVAPYDENLKVITRHIRSKVVLNYHTARAVLEWLEEKVETLEMEEEGGMMYEGEGALEQ